VEEVSRLLMFLFLNLLSLAFRIDRLNGIHLFPNGWDKIGLLPF
jgi:hypothetical protein